MSYIILILIIVGLIWLYCKFSVKRIKTGSLVMVTGGVKTGKTTLGVHLAIKNHKREMLRYRLKRIFKKGIEQPYLYSNIPIIYKYYKPLRKAHLLRKKRFEYRSIIYVCEASLVADSMYYKDQEVNDQLLLLNKLIGHETRGGMLIYDTQSIQDNHFAVKRCINSYFYIHRCVKCFPFFIAMKLVELRYSDDNSVVNVSEKDIEDQTKWCLIPKKVWKRFDCYCYSAFTDGLPLSNDKSIILTNRQLKADHIISFKKLGALKEFVDNEN